ncbi:MAG TPA: peptide chain release factor N(5)-glutamine methyltransferase [Burkholderiales bacterium]|nr:peptide chain release factor N(5)-glutamine methyltransferase [Burkholderiales bacterium]
MRALPADRPTGAAADSVGATLVRDGARLAAALGVEFADGYREAQGLLAAAACLSRAQIAARQGDRLDGPVRRAYADLVERRSRGEPYAYLVGRREFHGLDFRVTPAVLIPRPETEILVDAVLARIGPDQDARILDLGTGSGAIAITLARLRPRAEVSATDSSAAALGVARANALSLAARMRFVESDWYAGLGRERFDVIVSNPPYVAAGDPHLDRGDLRFEPRAALVGGADGLDCLRALVGGAARHLTPGGALFFEHGHDQAAACRELLEVAGFQSISTIRDLAGIERVTCGQTARH